jgi:hypothetical protein
MMAAVGKKPVKSSYPMPTLWPRKKILSDEHYGRLDCAIRDFSEDQLANVFIKCLNYVIEDRPRKMK